MWERGRCCGLLSHMLVAGSGQKHLLVVLSLHRRWTVGSMVFHPCGVVQFVLRHGTTASGLHQDLTISLQSNGKTTL